ncbi:MAG: acetyl-CoA carboxyl transferase [Deltaproteobacteria bacterium]|nr:acetyl-CoA carboxyl transferase [Deltaproteobacteria bacterium]
MSSKKESRKWEGIKSWLARNKKAWGVGVIVGLVLAVIMVLASGFMIETTNKDTFCAGCHIMEPFRASWQEAVHGGKNPQGFAAQCVDCHLPHGDFFEFFMVKGITGTGDVIQNLYVDGAEFDWAGNAEKRRLKFTFESACRHCHHVLTPPGIPMGGLIAHRAYLIGETTKKCADCHPHVGHKDMIETANRFFKKS